MYFRLCKCHDQFKCAPLIIYSAWKVLNHLNIYEFQRQREMRKSIYILFALLTILTCSVALAFMITWSSTVTLVVAAGDVEVYWDYACTNPVTNIGFGTVQVGAWSTTTLYIKNSGTGTITLSWNSTLPSVTNAITDSWYVGYYTNIQGYSLSSGQVITTTYRISIQPTALIRSYTWTLNLGIG